MQINKDNICKNNKRVDHDYKVGDKAMLTNNAAYKYETAYKGPFVITQFFTIQMLNIPPLQNMYDDVNILSPFIYFCVL